MAMMKVDLPEISKKLCGKAAAKVNDFNAQGLVNILCAMATMKVDLPRISKTLCDKAAAKVQDFNSHELTNILWALSEMKVPLGSEKALPIKNTFIHFDDTRGDELGSRVFGRSFTSPADMLYARSAQTKMVDEVSELSDLSSKGLSE